MISSSIAHRFLWSIGDEPMGSNHVPITIFLNDAPPKTSRRPRWIYDLVDWTSFQDRIDTMPDNSEPSNISASIHQAAIENIPKTSPNAGHKAPPRWSKENKKIVKARRKALRNFKRLPHDHPQKDDAHSVDVDLQTNEEHLPASYPRCQETKLVSVLE